MIVSALFIYPVKSLRGIAVTEATVERRGFRHDRRFMVIDRDGQFMTQRTLPSMALVHTALEHERLVLRAARMPDFGLPLAPAGKRRAAHVWGDAVDAIEVEGEAGAWLSAALETPCALVYMPDDAERPVKPAYARGGDRVSFADAFPFLLTSESSLEDLNARLESPVEMERFRPNVVVRGAPAFAEDAWSNVTMGGIAFRVPKPCDRCTIPNVDRATGVAGKEPLRTLATFRTRENRVYFGQNLIHDAAGVLRVGDRVEPS